MSKILWLGDAGCHTGFGRVTHAIGERLVRDYGHDIHVLAVNYDGDHIDTNLKLYVPNKLVGHDMYGQSRFVEMLSVVEPDVVVILNDPFPILKFLFRNNWDTEKVLLQYRPILAYMPIDGINQPSTWEILKRITRPVVMAEHGLTWAPEATIARHGVDTELFRPASVKPLMGSGGQLVRSKKEAKKALGYDPDGFLVARVDRNSRRKDFGATWKALVPVMKRHKDIQVHFHCKGSGDDGVELPQLFSREPDIADRFFLPGNHNTSKGWPEEDLAILYNAADLVVSTSWGEGFGLTNAEALACGTPVIAQNVSSITEVVGPGGVLIEPAGTITVVSGEDQWLPDIPAFTDAIEHLYAAGGTRRKLGEAGRSHIVAKFSWDECARVFDQTITELAANVTENGEDDARNRAAEGTPPRGPVQDHVGGPQGVRTQGRGR